MNVCVLVWIETQTWLMSVNEDIPKKESRELLKTKRWEELSFISFMKSCVFGPTFQFHSSFRYLWCSSASIAVLCVSFFFQRQKKSAVLFMDLFLEACLNKLMTSATQTICIWRVLFQNEIFTVWKKGRLHRQNDWQVKFESRLWWYFMGFVSNLCPW